MEANDCTYPNLIIAGVFKAGTTSLFAYLSAHKDVGSSSKKELGYFVPLQFDLPLQPIDEYKKYFLHLNKTEHKYIMEASPGYLYGGGKVAHKMKEILGNFKVIFILRNPEERLNSFYYYLKGSYMYGYHDRLTEKQRKFIETMSFEEYVKRSYEYTQSQEANESEEYLLSGVKYGLYAEYLNQWYNVIDKANIKVIFFEELKYSPQETLNNICNWLEIPIDQYDNYDFVIQNKTINVKNKLLHSVATKINRKIEPILIRNQKLKNNIRNIYNSINKKDSLLESNRVDENTKKLFVEDEQKLKIILQKFGCEKVPSWVNE